MSKKSKKVPTEADKKMLKNLQRISDRIVVETYFPALGKFIKKWETSFDDCVRPRHRRIRG